MGARRTRPLSRWGESVLKRLRRLDRTVVELAAGLHRSTSTVYRWLASTPPPDVQRAADTWLRAIDPRAVDWERAPRLADDADALATRTQVLADRALRMARRRAADQTSVTDAIRLLEHLARHTFPLVAAANLLSVILRYGDAALGAWTSEPDPTLLWAAGAHVWTELTGAHDGAGLLGQRLSALHPALADELAPQLERLIATGRRTPLRTRTRWPRPNGIARWTDGLWYAVPGTQDGPCSLWTVYRVVDPAVHPSSPAPPVRSAYVGAG